MVRVWAGVGAAVSGILMKRPEVVLAQAAVRSASFLLTNVEFGSSGQDTEKRDNAIKHGPAALPTSEEPVAENVINASDVTRVPNQAFSSIDVPQDDINDLGLSAEDIAAIDDFSAKTAELTAALEKLLKITEEQMAMLRKSFPSSERRSWWFFRLYGVVVQT